MSYTSCIFGFLLFFNLTRELGSDAIGPSKTNFKQLHREIIFDVVLTFHWEENTNYRHNN